MKRPKKFSKAIEQANDLLTEVVDSWIAAEERVKKPAIPSEFPVVSITPEADIDQQA